MKEWLLIVSIGKYKLLDKLKQATSKNVIMQIRDANFPHYTVGV